MFCTQCGLSIHTDSRYCSSCGTRVPESLHFESVNDDEFQDSQLPTKLQIDESEKLTGDSKNDKWGAMSWLRLTLLLGIAIPAITTATSLPIIAEYVIFRFNINSLLNGGWLTWYQGDTALLAKAAYEDGKLLFMRNSLDFNYERNTYYLGMSSGYARSVLWFVAGLFGTPAFKDILTGARWIRREILK